jgi:hypothetical protein
MYRSAWTCSIGVAGAAGLWAARVEWSLGAVSLFFFLALTAFCIRLIRTEQPRQDWRRAGWGGLLWGLHAWQRSAWSSGSASAAWLWSRC